MLHIYRTEQVMVFFLQYLQLQDIEKHNWCNQQNKMDMLDSLIL